MIKKLIAKLKDRHERKNVSIVQKYCGSYVRNHLFWTGDSEMTLLKDDSMTDEFISKAKEIIENKGFTLKIEQPE